MKKVYVIGIGGIGVSAIARYYKQMGYKVFGSDKTTSELIGKMQNEGIDIIIGEDENRIDESFEKIIYTEAVPKTQIELKKAISLGLEIKTYSESLAEIANKKKLITITGTHGKSTTTSMTSIVLKNSNLGVNSVVGSLLKEFDGKNCYYSDSEYFVLEACEYKRSFLKYKPFIAVITNIDLDHLDYYKDLPDYILAFEEYAKNIIPGGYLIINPNEENSKKLIGIRDDINYVLVSEKKFILNGKVYNFPNFDLKIPGKHIEFDAKLAFVVGKILGLQDNEIKNSLEKYNGIWRRSEIIGETKNNNILMSDYGHHPTEISLNLEALKKKYLSKKIVTIFQPHQYNRTLELLQDFKNCFGNTDILIIPDIYESRDSEEDKAKINGEKLTEYINHPHKIFGDGLKNTLNLIKKLDQENPGKLVFILQGAGNVDDLRYEIKTK
ncbi:MAG: UDP-N-acetylmuramate--L-alanine ligase [Candidatus Gracilibacteria bacterium]|nr:UDP-N-acetylmuramate--L-alanine ligase [Candidatus Gracilibacteria bacterium]